MKINRWFVIAPMLGALLGGTQSVFADSIDEGEPAYDGSSDMARSAVSDAEVQRLQERLMQMENDMRALRAEIDRLSQAEPTQEQKVQEIEQRIAAVERSKPKVAGNRVFFRGGWAKLKDDRGNGAFTDMNDIVGGLGAAALGLVPAGASLTNDDDDGWYFGAGFDFLLSRDTLGLLPGTWTLAELTVEFRNLGSEETHLIGPVAECLIANNAAAIATGAGAGVLAGVGNCAGITGSEDLMMLTVSASPKLKFREGKKLRPWIIPAGFDVNVISPPSDSTNYLDVGIQFAAGIDYEIMPGITLGADFRYHWAADLTDPEYSSAARAAAAANLIPFTLNDDASNDTYTAGISLGIGF